MATKNNHSINITKKRTKRNQTPKNTFSALRLTLYELLRILALLWLTIWFVGCDNAPSELKGLTPSIESQGELAPLNLCLHLAPLASNNIKVTKVVLTVTGPGIEAPIVKELSVQAQREAAFVIRVPTGANRLFVAEAFDKDQVVLRNEQTIDLPLEKPEPLVMLLELASGVLPKERINEKDGATMLLVPAGEFVMGSARGEAEPDEHPQHRVYLSSFYIDKFEVKNANYKKFIDSTEHPAPEHWKNGEYPDEEDNFPVVFVSWRDANAYCQWAGKRLPTEAEWEKAARGTEGQIYPWGGDFDWKKGNFSDKGQFDGHIDGFVFTAPVGSFPEGASPYGVQNMAGNVWEWCADWYQKDYYQTSPRNNPKGPDTGAACVLRGGSFFSALHIRCAARYYLEENSKYFYVGFRCVADVE